MYSTARSKIKRPPVYRVVGLQFLLAFSAAAIALIWGTVSAYSALLGGLVCAVPSLYFAYRVFAYRGAQAARLIVKSFYKAEAVKLGLTAILFGLIFALVRPLEPAPMFLAFITVQLSVWFAPLIMDVH